MKSANVLLYMPVLHQGYLEFIRKHCAHNTTLYLLGKTIADLYSVVECEIRAIDPEFIQRLFFVDHELPNVEVLEITSDLSYLNKTHIVVARDPMVERFIHDHLPAASVTYDTVFLRWNESHVDTQSDVKSDRISTQATDQELMLLAYKASEKSSDWWRQVGAVITSQDGIIAIAHNEHPLSPHAVYAFGDIRDHIPSGEKSDVSSTLHAEKNAIALAARVGSPLESTSIYTTVFPCADCARIIAKTGISKCFFHTGHANFDGVQILQAHNIEIIQVKLSQKQEALIKR